MSSAIIKPSHRRVSIRGHPPDLVIRCGNRTFKAHQEQLVGKPGLLDAVRYEGIQDGCALVQAHDLEPSVLSCILDYFYTGDFDESGLNPYVPSIINPDESNGTTDSPLKSPSGFPSAERNKRLAAVYTMAQKYKITELKELVQEKFASNGKLSEYLSAIIKDNSLNGTDMGRTLHAKLQKVVLASTDPPEAESVEQTNGNDGENVDGDTTENGINKTTEDEKVNNPTNTPVVDEPLSKAALSTMEALNESLQSELATIRATHEEQTKEFNEQKSQLLVLKHEKLQAELSRDSAIERLEGLMKVINETKKCKNGGCLAPLNVSVQENEVRMKGNVTIRCGHCNARQR
ncbi:uncharacterized protein DFL_004358 [Arthrobotrys flagrans]|uniref:BTB domain-containing protein n=1 Tax=Arthrobotrys flagrans TaxID=97331 RepID=A0A437A4I0_ARTFL|nr:hypothetical protein DFL_004358 [Arthrobotrys flagrans]